MGCGGVWVSWNLKGAVLDNQRIEHLTPCLIVSIAIEDLGGFSIKGVRRRSGGCAGKAVNLRWESDTVSQQRE